MSRRFKVREIAQQSGLSEATVDRVLNGRPGVREGTRGEVQQAIADLERQRTQLKLVGRKFIVDVVLQAPARFSDAVRDALERELPTLAPAVVRSRFHFRETGSVDAMTSTLDKIRSRGSHGVIVKAPDTPEVVAAIDGLVAAKIPVVTLVTDVPGSRRAAYVGIDNRAAGATAAYLIDQWLGDRRGAVLVSMSSGFFRNEEEREMGFRSAIRASAPPRRLIDIPNSDGLDETSGELVRLALESDHDICAVYSIGGGNLATVDAFDSVGRDCAVFIAHDLDEDNRKLLGKRKISAVLHHDLRADLRQACRIVMNEHGAMGAHFTSTTSPVQVVTPLNMPPR
ncbi:LacI family DNA-binding transcriptional regulator [Rhodococcus marinonascens]|uniref:LacI family DNA-binding transcriptional regulator n=1 Tax=Rhodococcus marinonascens TaxID=38311 RepID=UPI000932E86E|nr:LacI family DNA-binding transcriptional regulator [Rhodococcus marinonascens]